MCPFMTLEFMALHNFVRKWTALNTAIGSANDYVYFGSVKKNGKPKYERF